MYPADTMSILSAILSKCNVCNVVKTALSILFTAVMTAALLGVYVTHGPMGESFIGSAEGSLSILALVITLMLWTLNLDCSKCPNPRLQQSIVFVLLVLATVASIIGMVQAHMGEDGFVFGTFDGSLSIIAFSITGTYWAKHLQVICDSCTLR